MKKERIQGVVASPLRTEDFRESQKLEKEAHRAGYTQYEVPDNGK